MKYTKAQFDNDKYLVSLAEQALSARVAGQSGIALEQYASMYLEIAKKFEPDIAMVKEIGFMFADLMMDKPLGGFKCMEYEKLLKVVRKRLGSLMFFRRKKQITCFEPRVHLQPCYCARLEAIQAVEVAPEAVKEEVAARVSGLLVLESAETV